MSVSLHQYDPETREAIVERAARILADEAKEAAGGIDNLIVLRASLVSQLSGLSKAQVPRKFPIRDLGENSSGVTLADYKAYLESAKRKTTDRQVRGGAA